jgi:uncharacterized protein (TIGR02145 family)
MALILSCSSGDDDNGNRGTPVTYDGETYETVVIGTQTWMARNLNYNASGSLCYDNDGNNCNKYGRLYDWETAMTACPAGWHIPSNEEWNKLIDYVEVQKSCVDCAGKYLKSTSGWWDNGNGENAYGFSALPGGGFSGGSFNYIGYSSCWWTSASENNSGGIGVYNRTIGSSIEYVYPGIRDKKNLFNVRCLQDHSPSGTIVPNSSSLSPGSSSSSDAGKGNDIANYKTVTIGSQTWMAENLNYAVSGSVCYDNQEHNCTTYGRLYDWVTAMALDASCYYTNCYSPIGTEHRGICPSGWHIPDEYEWWRLKNYVETQNSCTDCAGRFLKSTSGWWEDRWDGNGTDAYGFSALPGGSGGSGGFGYVGGYGSWWSASDYDAISAHSKGMSFNESISIINKDALLSVRCVKDHSVVPSSSSLSDAGKGNDIANYKTTQIGNQVWMAENLNYNVEGNVCYDNESVNCTTYGRLYSWAMAMALDASCNSITCSSQIGAKHRGICPSGWHIPSSDDWGTLIDYVEMQNSCTDCAGRYLKSIIEWPDDNMDDYGFSALPGGGYSDDYFYSIYKDGYWWSATENSASNAWYRYMNYSSSNANWNSHDKSSFFSVRCLQD